VTKSVEQRIDEWFLNAHEKQRFEVSMGDLGLHTATMRTLYLFLARAVAVKCYNDENYYRSSMLIYGGIAKMIIVEAKNHDLQRLIAASFGVVLEEAIRLVLDMKQKDLEK
jgi:hypothetical protein